MSAQVETWSELVVARLAELKGTGCGFEWAWKVALSDHPPRLRDLGPEVPSLFETEESLVVFFHRVCSDAWSGANPHMRHLETALQDLAAEPRTAPARRRSRAFA